MILYIRKGNDLSSYTREAISLTSFRKEITELYYNFHLLEDSKIVFIQN